jgi:hypothetical protein
LTLDYNSISMKDPNQHLQGKKVATLLSYMYVSKATEKRCVGYGQTIQSTMSTST